jgi:hypothetical protein
MANGTAAAAAQAKAKQALAKALKQRNNENTVKFFAAGMASMMVLFIVFNSIRVVSSRSKSRDKTPKVISDIMKYGLSGIVSLYKC